MGTSGSRLTVPLPWGRAFLVLINFLTTLQDLPRRSPDLAGRVVGGLGVYPIEMSGDVRSGFPLSLNGYSGVGAPTVGVTRTLAPRKLIRTSRPQLPPWPRSFFYFRPQISGRRSAFGLAAAFT